MYRLLFFIKKYLQPIRRLCMHTACCLLVWAMACRTGAQPVAFTLYNEQHGLPSGFVTRVFKDSRGILWLGTTNGLCRFDGRNFVTYDLKNGIPDLHVKYVGEHHDGRLIVGFHKGVYFFDGIRFTKSFEDLPEGRGFYFYRIHDTYDTISKLIINGVHYSWDGGRFKPLIEKAYPLFSTWIKFKGDTVLTSLKGGVYFAHSQNRQLLLPERGLNTAFHFLNRDTLLIAKKNALYCFNGITLTKLAAFRVPTGEDILDMAISENRFVWISIENFGVLRYDLLSGETDHYHNQNSILSNYEIPECFGDEQVWFASSRGLIKSTARNFSIYNKETSPLFQNAKAFFPLQDSACLLSNKQGLYHLTLHSNQSFTSSLIKKQTYFTPVCNLAQAKEPGAFWLADYRSNLYYYRSGQRQLTPATALNQKIKSPKSLVNPWYSKALNCLLFAGVGRVFCIDGGVITDTLMVEPATGVYLRAFAEDNRGKTWGIHLEGICKLTGNVFRPIEITPAMPATAELVSLLIQNDTLWAGTLADGLYGLVEGSGGLRRVVHFNETNGLQGNCVHQMVADDDGDIWLITNKAMQCLMQKNGLRKPVTIENEQLKFSALSYAGLQRDSKGIVWYFSPDCVYAIKPRGFKREVPQSPVFITSVYQNDSLLPSTFLKSHFAFSAPKNLSLSYRQNNLAIHYTSMCYNDEGILYRYRLDGAEENWNTDRKNELVTYTGLAPGSYTFRVCAGTPAGDYGPETAFSFTIKPPFYKTGWFMVVMAAFFLTAGTGWYRFKMKRVKKETMLKMQQNRRMAQMHMQALQAQMNPHFIFNSLNSIQDYILSRDPAEASRYLAKFAKLVRLILDNSSRNLMPLQEVAEMMNRYLELESLRMDEDFEYIISIDENLDGTKTSIPLMMVQPFVENAIWHGLMPKKGKKQLRLIFTLRQQTLECMIDDNGVGRKIKAAETRDHKSLGTQIAGESFEALGSLLNIKATLEVRDKVTETGEPAGTTVMIHLPLIDIDHYG